MNLTETVCAAVERETAQSVTPSTPIDALNVDSLEFMDLLLEIGSSTGMGVPDSKIGDLHTVGDIIEALC